MNKTIKATAVAIALLGTAGLAQAQSANDSMLVTVDVSATCALQPRAGHNIIVPANTMTGIQNGMYMVKCNDQLPFSLALDGTTAGGKVTVTDANTGRAYEVKMVQSATNTPWGNVANGEAYSGIGLGVWQNIPVRVTFNSDLAYGRPQVGDYNGTVTRVLSWTP